MLIVGFAKLKKIADSFKTLLSVLQKESFHYTKGKS